jgi:hypothetical protein
MSANATPTAGNQSASSSTASAAGGSNSVSLKQQMSKILSQQSQNAVKQGGDMMLNFYN